MQSMPSHKQENKLLVLLHNDGTSYHHTLTSLWLARNVITSHRNNKCIALLFCDVITLVYKWVVHFTICAVFSRDGYPTKWFRRWNFTILFSQSWQDCFWKFLQDIKVVGNLWLYFHKVSEIHEKFSLVKKLCIRHCTVYMVHTF